MHANTVSEADRSTQEILPIVGYADQLSVQSGQTINFMVSCTSPTYTANIVRLLGGMTNPNNNDIPIEVIHAECAGEYNGRIQKTNSGSYAKLSLPSGWLAEGEFTVQLWIWPTTPKLDRLQTVWTAKSTGLKSGADLTMDTEGHLVFTLTDGTGKVAFVRTERPLLKKEWYFVAANYSASTGKVMLQIDQRDGWTLRNATQISTANVNLNFTDVVVSHVLLAAEPISGTTDSTFKHFNGKIENPRFFSTALNSKQLSELLSGADPCYLTEALLVADYDFSADIPSNRLVDRSAGENHGVVHRAPTRAVTSHAWTGEYVDFRNAPPLHYAAVHFHDDDIEDAGWSCDFSWQLPHDLPTGVYALKLDAAGETDYVPFFVRPANGTAPAPVLFLAPTNTYLAYGNVRMFEGDLDIFKDLELKLQKQDHYLSAHPELGSSAYDLHTDGSGVCYSSRNRPIMNIRPHYRNFNNGGNARHLPADLYITGWLERRAEQYDVATDEDLHRDGINLLRPYKVLITGSHPEYWTRSMLLALKQYLEDGGRLMYLGGNGFYWVTSIDTDRPHLIEIRRGNAGTRTWDSPPGELYHSTTGESGGLWRHHGFVPQRLLGVGFTAQGIGPACGYRRLKDSFDRRVQFIFKGIGGDEPIGDFGLVMGGAVGDEVDRLDFNLGTPLHTLHLATSSGLDDNYQFVHEDQVMTMPGQGGNQQPLVRADMTYFDISGGGAVFSVGSINWAGSLAWNDYDNNVARISDNVLDHFLTASSRGSEHLVPTTGQIVSSE